MTTFLRKNFNSNILCLWRSYLRSFHNEGNYVKRVIVYNGNNLLKGSKHFATAVHGFQTNKYSGIKENTETSVSRYATVKSVDDALSELDNLVQQTGRSNRENVEDILEMIQNQGVASRIQGLYLLRACVVMWKDSPTERVELADQIWKKLQNLGLQFDVAHFNSLLRVYAENNHVFSPSQFLATMESHKVEPDKVTFVLLLEKYANDGNISGTSEVLEFMKEKGLPINEAVFNTLIKCHMKAKDVAGAQDILEVMRSSYSPSSETYTILACGYAELGDIEEMKSVLQKAEHNNVSFSTANILDIISALPAEHSSYIDKILPMLGDIFMKRTEVMNCVINLIHKDKCEHAFKLILAISVRGENNGGTNTFVKQLIKCEKPIDKVVDYCERIFSQQLNELIFINSAKAAVDHGNADLTMVLHEKSHKKGFPLRIHQFWSLLSIYKNSEEDILSILKKMCSLGVLPDFTTFERFIFPAITLNNAQDVISKLQESGLSHTSVIDPLFQYYCHNGDVDNALYLIENYPVQVYTSFNFQKFLSLYSRFRFNADVFCKLLNFVMKKTPMLPGRDAEVLQGQQLALLIQLNANLFRVWLRKSREEKDDCKFSQTALETCWDILKVKAPECLPNLRAFQKSPTQTKRVIAPDEEDKELKLLKEKGVSTENYLIERLQQHVKDRNIDRVIKLRSELDGMGVIYPPILCSQLLNFYCELNDLEAVEKFLHSLKQNHPSFKIETDKLLNYAGVLIKFSKFEEAKKVIAEECQVLNTFGPKDILFRGFKRLFYTAIESGNCDLVESIQNSLMHHASEFPTATLFHELSLRAHFHRNNLDSALDEFKKCVLNHKVLPCLNLMLKKCILANHEMHLKTVISLANGLVQENAVLHELAVAYLETGRKMQAIKIMKSLGNRVNPVFVEDLCSRLTNRKQVIELENYLQIVQHVEHLGKEKLFYNLFKLYNESNNFQKALDLYETIQREKLFDPSDRIKKLVSSLLKKNGQKSPLPEINISANTNIQNLPAVNEFLECVDTENVSEALEKLESMKKGFIQSIPTNEMSKFIDLLVRKKQVTEITDKSQVMSHIIENASTIIKPLLEKYSNDGDVESMKVVASFMPDFALKTVFFNSHYAKSHFNSGKPEELLQELENNVTNNKLFCFSALEGLLKVPHLEERAIKLAKTYLDADFDLPVTIVWAHYVTNGKYENAAELLKSFSGSVDRVDGMVLKAVRQDNNVKAGKVYIETLNQQNSRIRSKERAYGTLLDVLVSQNNTDEAVALLNEATKKGIHVEKHYRSTLKTLKMLLENENKEVPFKIPSEEYIISG